MRTALLALALTPLAATADPAVLKLLEDGRVVQQSLDQHNSTVDTPRAASQRSTTHHAERVDVLRAGRLETCPTDANTSTARQACGLEKRETTRHAIGDRAQIYAEAYEAAAEYFADRDDQNRIVVEISVLPPERSSSWASWVPAKVWGRRHDVGVPRRGPAARPIGSLPRGHDE